MLEEVVKRYLNILHIRLTDAFYSLPSHTLNNFSPTSWVNRLKKVILYTGGRLILPVFQPIKNEKNLKGKIWLYVVSQNNYESLKFLAGELPEAAFVAGQNKQIGRYNQSVNRISLRSKIRYYYLFPFVLWGVFRRNKKKAIRFFDLIYDAIGFYEVYSKKIKKYQPRCIIFSNDHNSDTRGMLLAAKKYKIPTVYIQHASVSAIFPPLEFDLNLLEGEHALEQYRLCGPISGEVKLIGMPKADTSLKERNQGRQTNNIGIAGNLLDQPEIIENTIISLASALPDKAITYRPHPSDKRDYTFLNSIVPSPRLSDAKKESVFEFLKKQDIIIAANSSIHLEATLLNVFSIYFKFSQEDKIDDYYGYVKHGLSKKAETTEDVIAIIRKFENNRPSVYQHARYYNAALGTEHEGKSGELAISIIRDFLASFKLYDKS